MNTIIAIQGIKGSFHHQVAQEYFGVDVEVDECLSFDKLIDSLLTGKSDQAVMAIENSIAGPIIPNYALIDKNNLHIIGEHYLDIHQNLMGLKDQKIKDILEVHSHPMALLQCMEFLKKYPKIKEVGEPGKDSQGKEIVRSGIVHRLDRGTSGVMLVAKTQKAFEHLKKQFQAHETKKITGLKMPESAIAAKDGRVFVSEIGEFGKEGVSPYIVV